MPVGQFEGNANVACECAMVKLLFRTNSLLYSMPFGPISLWFTNVPRTKLVSCTQKVITPSFVVRVSTLGIGALSSTNDGVPFAIPETMWTV